MSRTACTMAHFTLLLITEDTAGRVGADKMGV